MKRRTKLLVAGTATAAALTAGAGVAVAGGAGEDNSPPITGDALDKAKAIAIDLAGGGRVTESELGDEEGYYEVEVTRADGSQMEVHLDAQFNVISSSADSEEAGDDKDGNENEGNEKDGGRD